MRRKWPIIQLILLLGLLAGSPLPAGPVAPTRAAPGPIAVAPTPGGPPVYANPAFARLWTATDQAVATGQAARPWLWGPRPWVAAAEPFAPGADGTRLVQYFDK